MRSALTYFLSLLLSCTANLLPAQSYLGFQSKLNAPLLQSWRNPTNGDLQKTLNAGLGITFEHFFNPQDAYQFGLAYMQYSPKISYGSGTNMQSWVNHYAYNFGAINLTAGYKQRLIDKDKCKLDFMIGLDLLQLLWQRSYGNGKNATPLQHTDSSGNIHNSSKVEDWERNENKSRRISNFNAGAYGGFALILPCSANFQLVLDTKAMYYFNNFLSGEPDMPNTKFLAFSLGIGVNYRLGTGSD